MLVVERKEIVPFFVALGFPAAGTWSRTRMLKRIETLNTTVDEDAVPDEHKALFAEIMDAIENKTKIELNQSEPTGKTRPVLKNPKKKKELAQKEENVDTDDTADSESDVVPVKKKTSKKSSKKVPPKTKQPAKKKVAKKQSVASSDRKTITGTLRALLEKATKDKPITKVDMLAVLVKEFPDREEAKMRVTMNTLVPTDFRNLKGLNVQKEGDGFYID